MADSRDDPGLLEKVNTLAENTAYLAEAYEEENRLRGIRIHKAEMAIRATIIVAVLAVAAAVIAIVVAGIATNALGTYKHDTQKVRINACYQSNAQQLDQAKIEKGNERARRVQSPATKALSDRILAQLHISQAEVDRFNAEQLKSFDAHIDQAHRLRDCTAEGVADYLSGRDGYLKPGQKNPPQP